MTDHDFDIAVTFAGEDREFVAEVVGLVKEAGFRVFYDEDATVEMWGRDLTEYFPDVYERRSRFAVMFVSEHYAAKLWTRAERRSVLARALQSDQPYLLPVRLDATELPGVRSTVGYLDARVVGAAGVADAVKAKLGSSHATGARGFNGRVPRTPGEATVLLEERPRAWEYLLFSYCLSSALDQRRAAYNDHRIQFALGGESIQTTDLTDWMQSELGKIENIIETFDQLLRGPALDAAMGAPGEPGDPDLIEHLASRMMAIYDELLQWAHRFRSASTPLSEGRAALRAVADYVNQPIESIRQFVSNFQAQMDEVTTKLDAGETVEASYMISWDIPPAVKANYEAAFERLARRIREQQ